MPVIIGCPVMNDHESFIEMIFSLMKSTKFYEKIVIVESDGDKELWKQFKQKVLFPRIEIIHAKKEGPLKAYNKLFEIAKKRKCDLLLTQTDVIFPELYKRDWLEIMSKTSKNFSMVTCINGGGISGPDYIEGFRWVGGWCTYIPLETIEKLGGFDENFPNGFGVDIDYSYACSKIKPIGVINYWVDHHMMNERQHDNDAKSEEMKKEASKYFKKKWKNELD